MPNKHQVFISYRSGGGHHFAESLRSALEAKGYRPFLASHEHEPGPFPDRLASKIVECEDFLIVLSAGCFSKTAQEDWFLEEIRIALTLKTMKNIVPVKDDAFVWPDELPQDLQSLNLEKVEYIPEYHDASIQRLGGLLRSQPTAVSEPIVPPTWSLLRMLWIGLLILSLVALAWFAIRAATDGPRSRVSLGDIALSQQGSSPASSQSLGSTPLFHLEGENCLKESRAQTEMRSNASAKATLHLSRPDRASWPLDAPRDGIYELVVGYSNDDAGPGDELRVLVDGKEVASLHTVSTRATSGEAGDGWNRFRTTPPVYLGSMVAGHHTLTLAVDQDDGYGVEIDYLDVEERPSRSEAP